MERLVTAENQITNHQTVNAKPKRIKIQQKQNILESKVSKSTEVIKQKHQ